MDEEKEVTKEVQPETLVSCQACQAERPLREFMHEKPVDTDEPGVREVGLLCPECGDWTHIRFDNRAMRRAKRSLDQRVYLMRKNRTEKAQKAYYRAKVYYQAQHDYVQSVFRPIFGMDSPTELLGQTISDIDKLGDE